MLLAHCIFASPSSLLLDNVAIQKCQQHESGQFTMSLSEVKSRDNGSKYTRHQHQPSMTCSNQVVTATASSRPCPHPNCQQHHKSRTMEDAVNVRISEPLDIVKLALGE
jgi:hypothetical protein